LLCAAAVFARAVVTPVNGAGVVVVTTSVIIAIIPAYTLSASINSAANAVVANNRTIRTCACRITYINATRVPVITFLEGLTVLDTGIIGARVLVITVYWDVGAEADRVTGIFGAGILVITDIGIIAKSFKTYITCARVAIIAV